MSQLSTDNQEKEFQSDHVNLAESHRMCDKLSSSMVAHFGAEGVVGIQKFFCGFEHRFNLRKPGT